MPRTKPRYIVHVDMDAFFAAVEQRDDPSLKDKPVIIGSDPKEGKGRGVVSTCSYEARAYGIHSAMPISAAYRKCPHGVFLRGNMNKYSEASHRVFDILESFTPDIQPVSIDEAFMDITGSNHLFGGPLETCKKIKNAIKSGTGLTASLGMAPNMMTAKIASDIEKPDGLVVVGTDGIREFLDPLPIRSLWGIGPKTAEHLKMFGINTIGELSRMAPRTVEEHLGAHGSHAWALANGIDDREVEVSDEVGSISNEHTFETDTNDIPALLDTLMRLSEKVSGRLRKSGLKGRTVTLKIRFGDFRTYTRAATLNSSTNFANVIYGTVRKKLEEFDLGSSRVRLLGVKVSNFTDTAWSGDLFEGSSPRDLKNERIHEALDRIIDKYGSRSIRHRS